MPTATTKKRAQARKREGKAATTQAGEFVREKMHKMKRGQGNAKSRKQAVAIGLSEARRAGVKVPAEPRSKRQGAKTGAKKSSSIGRKPATAKRTAARKSAKTRSTARKTTASKKSSSRSRK